MTHQSGLKGGSIVDELQLLLHTFFLRGLLIDVCKTTLVFCQIYYFKYSLAFFFLKAQLQAPPWLVLSPFMSMWSVCTCLLSHSLQFKWKI